MNAIGVPLVISHHSADPDHSEWLLQVNPDLPCLAGHFPGMPVVPGVAQLAWAVHFAAEQWGLATVISQTELLKFQRLAQPPLQLKLSLEKRNGKVLFAIDSDQGRHASGRLVYGAA